MLHLFSLPLGNILGLGPAELGIMVGMIALPIGVIIVVSGMYFRHQQQKLWHETARIALEKGQPLPPLPAEDQNEDRGSELASDFRSGLILVGTGIGLRFIVGPGIAAVVGFIGVALLVYATFALMFRRKNPSKDSSSRS